MNAYNHFGTLRCVTLIIAWLLMATGVCLIALAQTTSYPAHFWWDSGGTALVGYELHYGNASNALVSIVRTGRTNDVKVYGTSYPIYGRVRGVLSNGTFTAFTNLRVIRSVETDISIYGESSTNLVNFTNRFPVLVKTNANKAKEFYRLAIVSTNRDVTESYP